MIPLSTFPDVSIADIVTELQREADARRRTYPDMVRKGNMTNAEAEDGFAIIAAMLSDCGRMAPAWRPREQDHTWSWDQRRVALQRELALRERLYPRWIEEGRLAQDNATRQARRLRALLWIYEDGFDWRPSNGLAPPWNGPGEDYRQARIESQQMLLRLFVQRRDIPMANGVLRMLRLENAGGLADELEARMHAQLQPEQQKEMAL